MGDSVLDDNVVANRRLDGAEDVADPIDRCHHSIRFYLSTGGPTLLPECGFSPGVTELLMSILFSLQAFPKFGPYCRYRSGLFALRSCRHVLQASSSFSCSAPFFCMIWIPVGAFQSIDPRLEEAARDVGASPLQVFLRITLPQARAAIGAALLLTFVNTFYEIDGAVAHRHP